MINHMYIMLFILLIILDVCHQDISWTYLSRYKHSGDISTIEISLQSLICLIFVYGINIFSLQ